MPSFNAALIIAVFALSFAVPANHAFAKKDPPPVPDPSLDPFSSEAGSFLDADLAALRRKAEAAYAAGDMKGAARAYLELLQHDILDGTALYDLACCYGRMGEASKAARSLIKAVEAGFGDIGRIRRDPDFDAVRGRAAFDLAVDAIAARLQAREAQWGESVWVDGAAPIACRVRVPEGLENRKSPPLLVALHGFASRPESLTPLWDAVEKPAFVFASPQAPFALPGSGRPVYSWRPPLPEGTREDDLRALGPTERTLVALIGKLKERYAAGEVYLMGFSQGAGFAYAVGLRHPELLAGLLCFGGRFPAELLDAVTLKEGKSIRVFIAHGDRDAVIPPAEGDRAAEVLRGNGFAVTTVRFEGGHEVSPAAFRRAAEWMTAPPAAEGPGNADPKGLQ